MEIKDRFKEGMVFLGNSPTHYAEGVSCLLCGEFIETYILAPIVCSSCKDRLGHRERSQNLQRYRILQPLAHLRCI